MFGFTWHRIAAYVVGAGTIAAGTLVPGLQLLVPVGTGMLGLATRWPEDAKGGPHPPYKPKPKGKSKKRR